MEARRNDGRVARAFNALKAEHMNPQRSQQALFDLAPLKKLMSGPLIATCVACATPDASTQIGVGTGGLEIVSDLHHYKRTEGDATYYRTIRLRLGHRDIDFRDVSNQLFPERNACASSFYRMSDIRLSPGGVALALFAPSLPDNYSICGKAQLVRLSVVDSKLKVERIDLSSVIDGEPSIRNRRAGVDEIYFGDPNRGGYGYSSRDAQVQAQIDSKEPWLLVPLRSAKAKGQRGDPPRDTVAINLRDLSIHNLGAGEVSLYEENNSIALMSVRNDRYASVPYVQFKAVKLADGSMLDSVNMPLGQYTVVGGNALDQLKMKLGEAKSLSAVEAETAQNHYRRALDARQNLIDNPKLSQFDETVAVLKSYRDKTFEKNAEMQAASVKGVAKGGAMGEVLQFLHDEVVADAILGESSSVIWGSVNRKLNVSISTDLKRAR